jgi:NAD kinase
VAVGGDGTILNCASFLGSDIPLLGINSDPTPKHELGFINKVSDERRVACTLYSAIYNILYTSLYRGRYTLYVL